MVSCNQLKLACILVVVLNRTNYVQSIPSREHLSTVKYRRDNVETSRLKCVLDLTGGAQQLVNSDAEQFVVYITNIFSYAQK